jgi:phosphoglycerate dehydrogenase-like enzyme
VSKPVPIAVAPQGDVPDWVRDAVSEGGGEVVEPAAAEGLLWFDYRYPETLAALVADSPKLRWIHLLSAGVDTFLEVLDDTHVWTCGKGLSAEPLAEHALLLALAGLRGIPAYARATSWHRPGGRSLYDRPVTIVGAGGIAQQLMRHLEPFRCPVTVVRRQDAPVPGAARVVTIDHLEDALPGAQVVFLALSLTPETTGIIGRRELELMDERAWLVNVSRGPHVVTDDLVDALRDGTIGGAALDVTDPEPLPDDHPLWGMPNCLITPHTATTVSMFRGALIERIRDNVARFAADEPLLGRIDVAAGY